MTSAPPLDVIEERHQEVNGKTFIKPERCFMVSPDLAVFKEADNQTIVDKPGCLLH